MDFWEDDAQTEDDFLENWSVLGWAEFSELEIQQSFDGYPLPGFFQFANWKMAFWSHGLEKPFSMVILSTVLFFWNGRFSPDPDELIGLSMSMNVWHRFFE